jgi:hypothetical protein
METKINLNSQPFVAFLYLDNVLIHSNICHFCVHVNVKLFLRLQPLVNLNVKLFLRLQLLVHVNVKLILRLQLLFHVNVKLILRLQLFCSFLYAAHEPVFVAPSWLAL